MTPRLGGVYVINSPTFPTLFGQISIVNFGPGPIPNVFPLGPGAPAGEFFWWELTTGSFWTKSGLIAEANKVFDQTSGGVHARLYRKTWAGGSSSFTLANDNIGNGFGIGFSIGPSANIGSMQTFDSSGSASHSFTASPQTGQLVFGWRQIATDVDFAIGMSPVNMNTSLSSAYTVFQPEFYGEVNSNATTAGIQANSGTLGWSIIIPITQL